jgi:hypothetical protein
MNKQLIIAALSALLMGALMLESGPDEVIFPPQDIPIRFLHDYHVRKPNEEKKIVGEGLACTDCHENVATSSASSDRDIPGHGTCEQCHGDWIGDDKKPAPPELCAKCHTDPDITVSTKARAKMVIPDPNITFAHKSHVDAGIRCVQCHNNVPEKEEATRDDFPTMDRCIACHEAKGAGTECNVCHLALPSGRLQLEYPEGELAPRRLHQFAIHDADFLRDHGPAVKRDKAYCANCHGEPFCVTCHDGVGRDARYHPGDWLSIHFMRAKKDDFRCQSCHRLQTFCLDCHVRSGVASVNPDSVVAPTVAANTRRTIRTNGATAIGPHPMTADGWLNPSSRNFHGFFVQRNVRSCASCHQEQFCVTCHMSRNGSFSPTQIGGNPHGPNPERLKGSTARNRNARMCLKCHSPLDDRWR